MHEYKIYKKKGVDEIIIEGKFKDNNENSQFKIILAGGEFKTEKINGKLKLNKDDYSLSKEIKLEDPLPYGNLDNTIDIRTTVSILTKTFDITSSELFGDQYYSFAAEEKENKEVLNDPNPEIDPIKKSSNEKGDKYYLLHGIVFKKNEDDEFLEPVYKVLGSEKNYAISNLDSNSKNFYENYKIKENKVKSHNGIKLKVPPLGNKIPQVNYPIFAFIEKDAFKPSQIPGDQYTEFEKANFSQKRTRYLCARPEGIFVAVKNDEGEFIWVGTCEEKNIFADDPKQEKFPKLQINYQKDGQPKTFPDKPFDQLKDDDLSVIACIGKKDSEVSFNADFQLQFQSLGPYKIESVRTQELLPNRKTHGWSTFAFSANAVRKFDNTKSFFTPLLETSNAIKIVSLDSKPVISKKMKFSIEKFISRVQEKINSDKEKNGISNYSLSSDYTILRSKVSDLNPRFKFSGKTKYKTISYRIDLDKKELIFTPENFSDQPVLLDRMNVVHECWGDTPIALIYEDKVYGEKFKELYLEKMGYKIEKKMEDGQEKITYINNNGVKVEEKDLPVQVFKTQAELEVYQQDKIEEKSQESLDINKNENLVNDSNRSNSDEEESSTSESDNSDKENDEDLSDNAGDIVLIKKTKNSGKNISEPDDSKKPNSSREESPNDEKSSEVSQRRSLK